MEEQGQGHGDGIFSMDNSEDVFGAAKELVSYHNFDFPWTISACVRGCNIAAANQLIRILFSSCIRLLLVFRGKTERLISSLLHRSRATPPDDEPQIDGIVHRIRLMKSTLRWRHIPRPSETNPAPARAWPQPSVEVFDERAPVLGRLFGGPSQIISSSPIVGASSPQLHRRAPNRQSPPHQKKVTL